MEKILEYIKNIKIDLSNLNINKIIGYVAISIICYIFIPENFLNKVWTKLFDNKTINIIIVIFVLSFLVHIIDIIIVKIITYIKKRKEEKEKFVLIEEKFDALDFDCKEILSRFYDKDLRLFRSAIKIIPKEKGVKTLQRMDIIRFNDYLDEEGGYSIVREQLYAINEEYLLFLNKLAKSKKDSRFMEFMRNI